MANLKTITGSPSFHHWMVLGACVGALCLAAVLTPAPPGDTTVRIGGIAVPPLCGFKATSGIPCPGCGLTRSWVSAAHGRFQESLAWHRMGWVLMLYAATQAVRHAWWLAKPDHRQGVNRWGKRLDIALIPIILLMGVNYIPTVIDHFSGI